MHKPNYKKRIKLTIIFCFFITSIYQQNAYAQTPNPNDLYPEEIIDFLIDAGVVINTENIIEMKEDVCNTTESDAHYANNEFFSEINEINFGMYLNNNGIIDNNGDTLLNDEDSVVNAFFDTCVNRQPTDSEFEFYTELIKEDFASPNEDSSSSSGGSGSSSSRRSDRNKTTSTTTKEDDSHILNIESLTQSEKEDFLALIRVLNTLGIISDAQLESLEKLILGDSFNRKAQESDENLSCPIINSNYNFNRNLGLGSEGGDVKQLQIILNQSGYLLSQHGLGSPGNETTYFGQLTKDALIRLQNDCSDQILAPVGLQTATGFFGQSTINYLK